MYFKNLNQVFGCIGIILFSIIFFIVFVIGVVR